MKIENGTAFGEHVCSYVSGIDEHIQKHELPWTRENYVGLGDRLSMGRQGSFIEQDFGDRYFMAVVNGTVKYEGKDFGILRTIFPVSPGDVVRAIAGEKSRGRDVFVRRLDVTALRPYSTDYDWVEGRV